MSQTGRIVVASNRVPTISVPKTEDERRAQSVGGLVSAVQAAMEKRGGLWFGWSGSSTGTPAAKPKLTQTGSIQLATIDLTPEALNLFYAVFANRTLWPLLHSFPERVVIRHDAFRAYQRVNRRYAEALYPLLEEGDLIWAQDYHLIPLGAELRKLGWKGKLGFFLHTPFPPAEIFTILPWAKQLLEELLEYDLVGVHIHRYAQDLLDSMVAELGGKISGDVFTSGKSSVRVGVYPIGTDAEAFTKWGEEAEVELARAGKKTGEKHKLILAVDRLDYTKGIPERLLTFEHLLEHRPSLRGEVTMMHISAPSRTRVPEYAKEREMVDQLVGRINGRFSEKGWTPISYHYRSFNQRELALHYREADVCLVTPLRDGMNLVAKEFVASQGAEHPGVLVLSRFCGAAETMKEAIIVNPHDIEGTAGAIHQALTMTTKERRERWQALYKDVSTNTAIAWSEGFLRDLAKR
ncbi:MAG: trehalose-6-phosphate synthase [Chloroflexi bacterium]|nr:trehalose-6-phosphate synthase [Chloroflexota bacterium]